MGIHGLTGFIDNNQHVLHQHQLHDCSVVLDGNNFFHFIYHACHVRCGFGGDYDIYRKKIMSTFESFRICGVTPYVVMDGAYTVDGRKLRTSLSRATARIRLVDVMANHQRGQAMPILAYETFMQTLSELGICHITCQFEADNEIAVLANKLHCPVISNDSDFYIFDLNSGFLPLDYLDFRPLKNTEETASFNFLHCHKYYVDDFINSFDGLNRSVLPVFASLLGNDFINPSAFTHFYSQIKVPKIISKKFSLPPRLSKVISVLHWLHSQNESTEFLDIKREILAFIKPRRKDIVERMFVSSVNGYVDVENFQGFDLFNFVTVGPGKCHLTAAEDFHGYSGNIFPDWFLKAVCCGEITPSILNCAILHRVIILVQVEDLSQPSSFACSLSLRRLIYGIIFQDECSDIVRNQHNEDTEIGTMAGECLREESGGSHEQLFGGKNDLKEKLISDSQTIAEENIIKMDNSGDKCEVVENIFIKDCGCLDLFTEDLSGEKTDNFSPVGQASHEMGSVLSENTADACEVKEDNLVDDDDMNVKICEDDIVVGEVNTSSVKKNKDLCVEEYTRIGKNLLKSSVKPLFTVGNVSVPSLTSLGTMLLDDRRYIMAQSLGVNEAFMGRFSEDLQLFAACIVMWSRNASPRITLGHLDSVIAGVVLIRTMASLATRNGETKEDSDKSESNGDLEIRTDGLKHELGKNGDGDKSESNGDLETRTDEVKPEIKHELGNKGDGDDESGSNGDLESKPDVGQLELKQGQSVKDDGDIYEVNVECINDSNSSLMQGKDELSKTDIDEFRNISCSVVGDSSTNLHENTNQAEDPRKLNSGSPSIDIGRICSTAAIHDLEHARQNISKYHAKGPTLNNNNRFIPSVCHAFAQLQACIIDAINLNKLLRCPFQNIRPADLINGTFLYNFYVDISTRTNADLFLATMLGRKSDLFSAFEQFRNTIVDVVGIDNFVSLPSLSKKSRKRKSKVQEKAVSSDGIKMEQYDENEVSVRTVSGFNVANMFSVLSLDD